jgi:hypothetical protein
MHSEREFMQAGHASACGAVSPSALSMIDFRGLRRLEARSCLMLLLCVLLAAGIER